MRFRVGVSKCFNLPPQRFGVSLSAWTIETCPDRRRVQGFDITTFARWISGNNDERGQIRFERHAGSKSCSYVVLAWFRSGSEILCFKKQSRTLLASDSPPLL